MKNTGLLIYIILFFLSCNKTENMKNKIFPERPYEKIQVDKFYWADGDMDFYYIPLVKPYKLSMESDKKNEWTLDTDSEGIYLEFENSLVTKMSSFESVEEFNVSNNIIYGTTRPRKINSENKFSIPKLWFIYKARENDLMIFKEESDCKTELEKLNIPYTFLSPNEVYEQYKINPVLPWFPEDIKKQLKEIKTKK